MQENSIKYLTSHKWSVSRPGLFRIQELCNQLDNPQKRLKFIHVAGTNGKGSTCAYLSQIFIEAGFKVGQYTSPAILDYYDRIKINNKSIEAHDFDLFTNIVKRKADKMDDHPTEYEMLTAISFLYFLSQKCNIVVMEVGMGGRLDSTNVVTSKEVLCSVITRIGLDHTDFLGKDIRQITKEKEGIIKEGVPVVKFAKIDAGCIKNEIRLFSFNKEIYKTCLLGAYQPSNAVMAIKVANLLNIDISKIKLGIEKATIIGRFQIIDRNPYFVLDGSHNPQGIKALIYSLDEVFLNKKIVFVVGVLKDKNYKKIAEYISNKSNLICTITPNNKRALSSSDFAKCFKSAKPFDDLKKCLTYAKSTAGRDGVVCCCGSLYSVKDILKTLKSH